MRKYKIGDKVRVRNDLKPRNRYGNDAFIDEMSPCIGQIVTIDGFRNDGKYSIKEDRSCCNWTPEMFVGLVNEVGEVEVLDGTKTLEKGDKVTVRHDLEKSMCFQGWNVTKNMMEYTGREVTISNVRTDMDGIYYEIKEDGGLSCWTNQMFLFIKLGKGNAEDVAKALKNFSDKQLEQELERRKKES